MNQSVKTFEETAPAANEAKQLTQRVACVSARAARDPNLTAEAREAAENEAIEWARKSSCC